MLERQELWCHECGNYVQFTMDVSLNGNHVIQCPICGHEHLRVVKDGKITEERWGSRNKWSRMPSTNTVINVTSSSSSTYDNYLSPYTDTRYFTYTAWMNTNSVTS